MWHAAKNIAVKSVLFLLLSSVLASVFTALPTSAASGPSYKYYSSGSQIGATGGEFGSKTTPLYQESDGSKTYTGESQVTVVGWKTGIWPFQTNHMVTCVAGIQIEVGASDKSKGNISTPANLNNPPTVVRPAGSTYIGPCTADEAKQVSNFNQGNISISGKISDTGKITNPSEADNKRQIAVHVYPKSPPSQLPKNVKAVVSSQGQTKATKTVTFPLDMGQVYFLLDPGTYKICITPTSSKFGFDQCQNITKELGKSILVMFGSQDTGYNATGNLVAAAVHLNIDTQGMYGPISVNLIDGSGNKVATADTENSLSSASDTSITLKKADFNSVTKPGTYKVCLEKIPSLCSKKFNKKDNHQITWNDVPGPLINVPLNKSGQFMQDTNASTGTTCAIDGIGWIICPVVNFMAQIADSAYGYLADNFLNVKSQLFDTGADNPTYAAWSIMRNFANIAFVIAFLIIIFSQLTGFGIANYGIKKLLPRIIIAAILVNISYFICQIGVDLSNIFGKSLSSLFIGLGVPSGSAPTGFWSGGSWANLAGGILATAVAGAAVWASLGALIPILIAAVFALVMILFILVARQALIVLLVVISPLAFVAFLLPNTGQLFTKWRKALTALLLLYPIVALVYGVSSFASKILSGVMTGTLGQIAAASVVVLPLFIIPSLLKKSLDGIGNIGATLNNLGSKAGKAAGKMGSAAYENSSVAQYKKYRAAEATKRRGQIQGGTYEGRRLKGFNPRNWGSKAHERFNASKYSGEFGTRRAGEGAAMVAQAEADDLKRAQIPLQQEIATEKARIAAGGTGSLDDFLEARASAPGRSAAEHSAAMHALASTGRDRAIRRLRTDPGVNQSALQSAISTNAGALVGKAPELVKGNDAAFGSVTGKDLAGFSSGTAEEYIKHLETLHTTAVATGATPAQVKASTDASNSFNSAVEDITKDSSLQSSFDGEVGRTITGAVGSSSVAFRAYAAGSLTGLSGIGIDGKIR